jgi:predicted AAA+ superfamily ATPase
MLNFFLEEEGKGKDITVFPLSFREFLEVRGVKVGKPHRKYPRNVIVLDEENLPIFLAVV